MCYHISKITIPVLILIQFNISYAQDLNNNNRAFGYEASYIGDNSMNLAGGIKRGYNYLGMANLKVNFDTQKARLWKGGNIFLKVSNTHGSTPSADLFGDAQVVSNIEAGNHTYLQELWIKQNFKKIEITLGLQDLNVEFAHSEYGGLFLNSSFGILPLISGNTTAPIFPLTAPGFTFKWNISEKSKLLWAIYDGCPTGFEDNPYNLKWQFLSSDGILTISEFQQNTSIFSIPGIIKIGFFSHNHIIQNSLGKQIPDSINYLITGFTFHSDFKLWEFKNKSIGVFSQFGYSPSKQITSDFYSGLGINYTGICTEKGNDNLGLAVAFDKFANFNGNETTLELTYQYTFSSNFFIQPDFQYIINPYGTGRKLPNCLASSIRFGLMF